VDRQSGRRCSRKAKAGDRIGLQEAREQASGGRRRPRSSAAERQAQEIIDRRAGRGVKCASDGGRADGMLATLETNSTSSSRGARGRGRLQRASQESSSPGRPVTSALSLLARIGSRKGRANRLAWRLRVATLSHTSSAAR